MHHQSWAGLELKAAHVAELHFAVSNLEGLVHGNGAATLSG
jgi:hypothetical protein